ncbi:MAG: hypothetical protein RLZZ236_1936 [Bacteroidota bacterium]|jgi:hypothetical protein
MAGGKLLGFLQNNPQLVQGAKTAVGGFLNSKGLGGTNDPVSQETVSFETKGKKEDTKQNYMIYVALAAVAILFLMKKK